MAGCGHRKPKVVRRFFLSACAIGLLAAPASAKGVRVFAQHHVSVAEGLSQSHVTAIVQDGQGFVWIGTAVGLNRFDGYSFSVYGNSGRPGGLSDPAIYDLHRDARGHLWAATGKGLDRYDRATDSFQTVLGGRGRVRAVTSDPEGKVYAAVRREVVVRIDPDKGVVREYELPAATRTEVTALRAIDARTLLVLVRDPAGQVSNWRFAVFTLDTATGRTQQLVGPAPDHDPTPPDERDLTLVPAGGGAWWLGAPGNQVFLVDVRERRLRRVPYEAGLSPGDVVSHVIEGRGGAAWLLPSLVRPGKPGADNAIYRLEQGKVASGGRLRRAGGCDFDRNQAIASLVDRTNLLWTGLAGAGVCIADLDSGVFSHLHESSSGLQLTNNFVRAVWKTGDGGIWVGTRAGLDYLDRDGGRAERFRHDGRDPQSLSESEIRSLLVSRDGSLWVGTQSAGVNRRRRAGRGFERLLTADAGAGAPVSTGVASLLEDRRGNIWAATSRGLGRLAPGAREFTLYQPVPGDPQSAANWELTALFEDRAGRLWLGTGTHGLLLVDPATGRMDPVALPGFAGLNVLSLTEDPVFPGVLWIATLQQGLVRFDTSRQDVAQYASANSLLPSDTVYVVVAGGDEALWAGTNRGLVRIAARSRELRLFGTDQGLQSMEFNTRAGFRAADGEILLGGVGGVNAFYPRAIAQNVWPAAPVITRVQVRDGESEDKPGLGRAVFRNDGSPAEGRLGASTREIAFHFVGIHFADPERNRYRVRLDGFDGEWRDLGAQRVHSYTNLPPGPYRFRVQAASSRGIWSEDEASYQFTIAKPFYQSAWFLFGLPAALAALVFAIQRWRLRNLEHARRRLEQTVQQRTGELSEAVAVIRSQAEQLREADELKSRFLANISHDFRTPLSITLGTLHQIAAGEHGPVPEEMAGEIRSLMRNERRLLWMVNQLMAVARLDSGALRLRLAGHDLADIARYVVAAFRPVARQRRIELQCECGGKLPLVCDREWLEQALTNVVLNALKFTPAGGSVTVRAAAEAEGLLVSVSDTGPGIAREEQSRIFDRFYRTPASASLDASGAGVGLSLAKEIVSLHHGTIEVASEPGAGATFHIRLRAGSGHFSAEELRHAPDGGPRAETLADVAEDLAGEYQPAEAAGTKKPAVLVVDDDAEMRAYLTRQLRDSYRVLTAASGEEAWKLIQLSLPDLVVSDVAMPDLDGLELCRRLRRSAATDAIPLILITARTGAEDRIGGLETGADDYLAKPFAVAELRVRMQNLLDARARVRARIAAAVALDGAKSLDDYPEAADARFAARVYAAIRARVADPEFSVEHLADDLGMSRMHLYRRLKATLGLTPVEVLMNYRLEHAAELLASRAATVSEAAYAAGFKDLSHFSKRFRSRYGATPSEYRARTGDAPIAAVGRAVQVSDR